jgi:hypothetical protein
MGGGVAALESDASADETGTQIEIRASTSHWRP